MNIEKWASESVITASTTCFGAENALYLFNELDNIEAITYG